jgi:hypothetical protein
MDSQRLIALRAQKDRFFKENPQSPLTETQKDHFTGLTYFVPAPDLDLTVEVTPFEKKENVQIAHTKGDSRWFMRWGTFTFEIGAETARLTIYRAANYFFLPFVDALAGRETYGVGRYLEPEQLNDVRFRVDFNQAYNPYCAYGNNWNCPVTPAENRLTVPVRAGEKLPQGEWVNLTDDAGSS